MADLDNSRPYDADAWASEVLIFSEQWVRERRSFSSSTKGNPLSISKALYEKYQGAIGSRA